MVLGEAGYAILDPITGEGIYKISGGKNGGYLDAADKTLLVTNIKVDLALDLIEWGTRQGDPMKGMGPVIKSLNTIANFLGLASLGVTLTQAILKCQDNADALLKIVVPGLCAIFSLGGLIGLFASAGGPILAVIVRLLTSYLTGMLGDLLVESVCGKRARTRIL